MNILDRLQAIRQGIETPFLISAGGSLRFQDIIEQEPVDLSGVKPGDVVALIGDFDALSISTLLRLIDRGAILVPLTVETRSDHPYFFESALVDVVIEGNRVERREHGDQHPMIAQLRDAAHAGLVLFSTGTTGRPKAILHDMTLFLKRFETQRPTLKTLNFLLFDHIGGINTLLHTLFNKGIVVAPENRSVQSVLATIRKHDVELLPTTPTFLRMVLMSGVEVRDIPPSLKVVTYGTERMDQPTLDELCRLMPNVDFRQTFGMSELGIVRVKSKARDSLFMQIGGDGIETRIVDGVLQIRSPSRMLGYLNAPSPFDEDGWYNSKDIVEECDGYIRVVGRTSEVINVGGLKFMASEVERVALTFPDVSLVKAVARENPITGQHVELQVQPKDGTEIDKASMMAFLKQNLQPHMVPKRLHLAAVGVGHRYKRQ